MYERTAIQNTLLLHATGSLCREFERAGIDLLVLKGAALAEQVYPNIALRPMVDVDLLVRPAQASVALALLEREGYVPRTHEVAAGTTLNYENEIMLVKPGHMPLAVELHWGLLDSPHYQQVLALDWFWQTRQPLTIDGMPAATLGTEAQILHLCAHLLLHHGGRGLLWEYDLVALLHMHAGQIDWDEVLRRAAQYDLVLSTRRVLDELSEQWRAPVPADVLARLRDLQPSAKEEKVVGWMTADQRPVAQRFWADLASLPGWRQRLHYARLNLFPTAEYMRQRYHVSNPLLLPLAYPYRWALGLWGLVRSGLDLPTI